jgi:hypothetical protein
MALDVMMYIPSIMAIGSKNSNKIKIVILAIWEAKILAFLTEGIYEICL